MRIVQFSLLGLLVLVLGFGWWYHGVVSHAPDQAPARSVIRIAEGDGVREVADKLYDAKLISQRWHWNLYVVLTGHRSDLLAGEYVFTTAPSIRTLVREFTTPPEGQPEVSVKILEGWTAKDMSTVLEKSGVIDAKDFLAMVDTPDYAAMIPKATYPWLATIPQGASLEGFLFPDTYKFFVPSTPGQVVGKMLANFDQKYSSSLRTSLTDSGRSLYQAVILASIVERELQSDSDRAKGADLFLRRIAAGIPLQSDATVNYVTGKSATQPTLDDLAVDSPYNTYKYQGLPPGPIGNPGLSSLRAAINPEPNPYYYFLHDPQGVTHFSKTLEEHNANKAKYLP